MQRHGQNRPHCGDSSFAPYAQLSSVSCSGRFALQRPAIKDASSSMASGSRQLRTKFSELDHPPGGEFGKLPSNGIPHDGEPEPLGQAFPNATGIGRQCALVMVAHRFTSRRSRGTLPAACLATGHRPARSRRRSAAAVSPATRGCCPVRARVRVFPQA